MTLKIEKIRIPLRLGTRISDARQAFMSLGLTFDRRYEKSDAGPAELVWTTSHRRTTVHLIEDQYIDRLYVVVRGPQAGDIAQSINECRFSINTPELLHEIDATDLDDLSYPELVTSLALVTQEEIGEDTVVRLRKALKHVLPSVRMQTLEAMSYTDDPAYRDLAMEVQQHDRDNQVRQTAAALLGAYERIKEP